MEYTSDTIHVPSVRIKTSKAIANLRAVAELPAAMLRLWNERRAQHDAIQRLHALDDRLLRDIGLQRSQIESAVLTGRPDSLRKEQHR